MFRKHKHARSLGRVGGYLLATLLVFTWCGTSQAEIGFRNPQTLSEPGIDSAEQQVAVDSQDRAIAVWQAVSADSQQRLVQLVRLDPEGFPESVLTLAGRPNYVNPGWCLCPQLAIDAQDRVTVAWQSFDGEDLRIQATRLDANGIPGPVQTLSASDADAYQQQLAVDSSGRVTVAWLLGTESSNDRVQSVRLASDGTPESVQTLSPADLNASGPDLAFDRHDRATIAWDTGDGIQVVRLAANGLPGAVQTISPAGETAGLSRVVVDSQDRATVVWQRLGGIYEVKAVRLDASGTPGPVRTLSPSGVDVLNPQIAIDPQDRVNVTWEDFDQRVHVRRLGADGIAGPIYPLSAPDRLAGHPQVAAAPDGGAVVVWAHPPVVFIPPFEECSENEFQPQSDVVEAAFINPDGTPGPVRAVSAVGQQSQEAHVAIDSQGRPTATWESFDGSYFCPEATTRVQAGSGLDIVDVPPDVPVEEPPVSRPVLPGVTHEGTNEGAMLRLGARAVIRGRQVAVRAVCVGDFAASCEGEIGLFSRAPLSGERKRAGPREALFSRGSYRLRGGDSRIVKLGLSRFGRTLHAQAGPMTIRATARGRGVESRTVSITIASGHPRHDHAQ